MEGESELKKRVLALVFCVMACMGAFVPSAYALTADSSGSVVSIDGSTESETIESETIESDVYWIGESATITSSQIGGDIIGAGYTIDVESSTVGGNVRAAAQELTINATEVGNNLTIAGATVQVGQGTSANGVYAMADEFGFYGTASMIYVEASTVTIDGTVSGDVEIYADEVVIGSNTNITGTLSVYSADAPTIADGAVMGNYSYEYYEGTDSSLSSAFGQSMSLGSLLILVVSTLLIAWLAKKPVEESANMLKTNTVNMLLFGALTVALAPMVAILLLGLLVTAPFGLAIFCIILALSCVALPFTAAATGKAIFKDMNNVLSGLLIGIIAGVLSMFSFLAYLLAIYSAIFTAGYIVCKVIEKVRDSRAQQAQPVDGGQGQGGPYGPYYGDGQRGPQNPYGGYGNGQGYGGGYGGGYGYGNNQGQGYGGGYGGGDDGYDGGQGYGNGGYGDGGGQGYGNDGSGYGSGQGYGNGRDQGYGNDGSQGYGDGGTNGGSTGYGDSGTSQTGGAGSDAGSQSDSSQNPYDDDNGSGYWNGDRRG